MGEDWISGHDACNLLKLLGANISQNPNPNDNERKLVVTNPTNGKVQYFLYDRNLPSIYVNSIIRKLELKL